MRRKSRAAREAQRLQHENDVLREMVGKLSSTLSERVIESEAENDKLRELLSEVAKLLTNPEGGCLKPGCALGCPHHLECDEELGTCFYVDRMRDLGVGVVD